MAEKKSRKKENAATGKNASGKASDVSAGISRNEEKAAGVKKNPAGSHMRDAITAVILIAFSIFTTIVLLTDTTGQVGIILSHILKGLLGVVAYILPVYFMIYAVLLMVQKTAHMNSRTLLFTAILIFDLAMINSVRFEEIRTGSFSISFLKETFILGIDLDSAGTIGMLLGWAVYKLVDIPGLIILAVVVLLICVILVADTPISKFFDDLRIKKNQKKINTLTDRVESGTADFRKDTIPLPDLPVSGDPAADQSRENTGTGAGRISFSDSGGTAGRGETGNGTRSGNPASPENSSKKETNSRRIFSFFSGEKSGARTDAPDSESINARLSDFFSGLSGKNTEPDTVPLSGKKQILRYMNDDSLFKKQNGKDMIGSEPGTEDGTRLGLSPEDSAELIKGLEKAGRGARVVSLQDDKNGTLYFDQFSDTGNDEQAYYDSLKRGLEYLSETDDGGKKSSVPLQSGSGPAGREKQNFPDLSMEAELMDISAGAGSSGDDSGITEETVRNTVPELKMQPAVKTSVKSAGKSSGKKDKKTASVPPLPVMEAGQEADRPAAQQKRKYVLPPLSLLDAPKKKNSGGSRNELREKAAVLEKVLQDFGVDARVIDVHRGSSITRYEIQPATGVKVSSIVRLQDDIALNLRAKSLRIEAPIPGKAAIGIEVQNDQPDLVSIREMIESPEYRNASSKISFVVGEDITGNAVVADLKKMPHMLIAGSTGSGKSVCINSILVSLLYRSTPDEVKLILIDPKVVELGNYNGIPHMLIPVVTDPSKAAAALMWAVQEMEGRYKKFAKENVKNLAGFNEKMKKEFRAEEVMPQIVIIIDELADLMIAAAKQVEESICRLAQLARAAGMHMIVATQRPSVDVVTGLIKANVPSRIAFAVSSQVDSRTILDRAGAEKLVGNGDMLFSPLGSSHPQRLQGPFVNDEELAAVIGFWKEQAREDQEPEIRQQKVMQEINSVKADFGGHDDEDELFCDAVRLVIDSGQASASMLQRRFRIGYNRAGRLIDTMEAKGIIGPSEGSRPRKVLVSREEFEEGGAAGSGADQAAGDPGIIMLEEE